MAIAGGVLKINIATLGPLVLPISEKLLFFSTLIGRKVFNMNIKPFILDFKRAFEHFCIHSGGRLMIEEFHKNLHIKPIHVEASRMTLHRFGNASSSSTWYELSYIKSKGHMWKGNQVRQIAFGSEFKWNNVVWSKEVILFGLVGVNFLHLDHAWWLWVYLLCFEEWSTHPFEA